MIRFPFIASELFASENKVLIDALFKEILLEDSEDLYRHLLDKFDVIQTEGQNEIQIKPRLHDDDDDPLMSKNNMNLEEKNLQEEEMEERKIKRTEIKLENIFAKENYVDNELMICNFFWFFLEELLSFDTAI